MEEHVLSEELEISLIEHRLLQLFSMLKKWDQRFFYPFLIFNETFWRLPFEKRLSVLGGDLKEWLDLNSGGLSYFAVEKGYLDLIKSLKILYFSYTKIDCKTLIEHFKSCKVHAISEFSPFGDESNSPIKLLNEIWSSVKHKSDKESAKGSAHDERETLISKLLALDFFDRFSEKKTVELLFFLDNQGAVKILNSFLESLEQIDKSQKADLLTKFELTVVNHRGFSKKNEKHIKNILDKVGKEKYSLVEFDVFDKGMTKKFDYVISYSFFEKFPSEILYKTKENYFQCMGRVVCTGSKDERKKLLLMIKDRDNGVKKISPNLFDKLSYEIVFEGYDNNEAINILEANCDIPMYSYVNFSPITLDLIIKCIGILRKEGMYFVFDKSINDFTRTNLLLHRNEEGYISNQLNIELYNSLLKNMKDIKVNSYYQLLEDYLSIGLCDKPECILTSRGLMGYLNNNRVDAQKFFRIENYSRYKRLDEINRKVSFFEFLKRKKIPLLGIPSYLYRVGFYKFKKKVMKDNELKKDVDDMPLRFRYKYKDEFLISWADQLSKSYFVSNYVFSVNLDKQFDESFLRSLKKYGLKEEFLKKFIKQNSQEILEFLKERGEDYILSVQKC